MSEDLNQPATKKDLNDLARSTKKDINELAKSTKKDIDTAIDELAQSTKRAFDEVEERMATKDDMRKVLQIVESIDKKITPLQDLPERVTALERHSYR